MTREMRAKGSAYLLINLKIAKQIGLTIPRMCWRERIG